MFHQQLYSLAPQMLAEYKTKCGVLSQQRQPIPDVHSFLVPRSAKV